MTGLLADMKEPEVRTLLQRDIHLFSRNGRHFVYGKVSGLVLCLKDFEARVLQLFLSGASVSSITNTLETSTESPATVLDEIITKLKSRKVAYTELPYLWEIQMLVSESCNLRCSYCYGAYHENQLSDKLMGLRTGRRVVDFAAAMDVHEIGFFGGEPLLNLELIKDCVLYAESLGLELYFGMTTNGTLLKNDFIAFCKSHGVAISVSIDGDRANHNVTRPFKGGRSSYDSVMKGIQRLKDADALEMLEITYSNRHTDLSSMVLNAAKHCNKVSCTCVEGLCSSSKFKTDIVSGEKLQGYYEELLDAFAAARHQGVKFQLGGLEEMLARLTSPISQITPYICSGYTRRVTVTTDGAIYPCPETIRPEYCFGSIWDEELMDREVFHQRRLEILDSLSKRQMEHYWFNNIADACFARVSTSSDGRFQLENAEDISACLERLIAKLFDMDVFHLLEVSST